MSISELPFDLQQIIRDVYWDDIIHLCQLGLIELTPDGKGVVITSKGRACMTQTRKLENDNRTEN